MGCIRGERVDLLLGVGLDVVTHRLESEREIERVNGGGWERERRGRRTTGGNRQPDGWRSDWDPWRRRATRGEGEKRLGGVL